ncbi:MAG TPA: TVP38/TMEM64 family protein, partial [Rudaea sp.]
FFPFGGVTVGLAWLRCPLWLFLAATGFGGAVMTGIETALGAGLAKSIAQNKAVKADLLTDPAVFLPLIGLGLMALIPIVISKLRAKRTPAPAPEQSGPMPH